MNGAFTLYFYNTFVQYKTLPISHNVFEGCCKQFKLNLQSNHVDTSFSFNILKMCRN